VTGEINTAFLPCQIKGAERPIILSVFAIVQSLAVDFVTPGTEGYFTSLPLPETVYESAVIGFRIVLIVDFSRNQPRSAVSQIWKIIFVFFFSNFREYISFTTLQKRTQDRVRRIHRRRVHRDVETRHHKPKRNQSAVEGASRKLHSKPPAWLYWNAAVQDRNFAASSCLLFTKLF